MSNSDLRITEYCKSKFNHNAVLYLQETHSNIKNKNVWVNILVVRYFFLTVLLTHAVF